MLLLLTVVLGLAGPLAVSARPQSQYFVPPDYIEAVESLPLATQPPPARGPAEAISQRRHEAQIVLNGIKSYILKSLAMPCMPRGPPNGALSGATRRNLVRLFHMQTRRGGYDRSGLLKRAQSFYPSCDHPAEVDPDLARLRPSLDVYFNLTSFFPTVPDDVTIEQASLRVFKIPGPGRPTRRPGRRQPPGDLDTIRVSLHAYASTSSGQPEGTPWTDEATPWSGDATPWSGDVTPWSDDVTPWSGDVTPWSSPHEGGASSDVTPWSSDVTPWSDPAGSSDTLAGSAPPAGPSSGGPWLVDRLTVPASQRGWLTFDVRAPVRAWKLGADNWGFLLTVEDPAGGQLQPDGFFQDMECDVAVPSSPVPGLLVQVAQDADLEVQAGPRYPVLDLLTSEPAAGSPLPVGIGVGSNEPCPMPERRSAALTRRRHRQGRHRRPGDRQRP